MQIPVYARMCQHVQTQARVHIPHSDNGTMREPECCEDSQTLPQRASIYKCQLPMFHKNFNGKIFTPSLNTL